MKNGVLPIPRPLGPTRSSPKLTITRANLLVAFPYLPLAIAALVVVVAVDQIIVGRRQVHEPPSLLQSAWLLMLPPSSFVLPRLSSQTCLLLLLSSLPFSSLYHFKSLVNMCSCRSSGSCGDGATWFEPRRVESPPNGGSTSSR